MEDPFESLKTFVCDYTTDVTPFKNPERLIERSKRGGACGSRVQIEEKIGIWAMTPEQQRKRSLRAAATTQSQRWMCLVTGHISNPCGLSNHQKGRGIDYKDKSLRVRMPHLETSTDV